MDYAKLKDEINKTKKAINRLKSKKRSYEKELDEISLEKLEAKKNYASSYETKKQEAKSAHKKSLMLPYEKKRSELQESLKALQSKYDDDLSELTVDNLMQNYSNKHEILTEVKESADKLHEVIVDVVGERFCNELESQLEVQSMEIDEANLDTVINYFNDCGTEIAKISKKGSKIMELITKAENSIIAIDGSGTEVSPKAVVAIAGALIVVIFLGYKYVFPFYLIVLLVLSVMNILRNYKVLKIILAQKTIRDNVDGIEEMFRKQVLEEIDQKTKELTEQFESENTRLEKELNQVNEELDNLDRTADRSFVFDEESVQSIFDATLRQKENRESEINDAIYKTDAEVANLYSTLEQLNKELNAMVGDIQNSYLDFNRIGEDLKLDRNFIIDVVDSKPVFFEYPAMSTLCLYNDEKVVTDFIRLLILQIRVKLNPSIYGIEIFDPTNLGKDFLCFKPVAKDEKEEVVYNKLFKIVTSENEYVPLITTQNETLNSRIKTILAGYPDIESYNDFMLSIQSLTESYQFNFWLDPTNKILTDPKVLQLLRNGGSVGMYTHLFVKEDVFYKLGATADQLLDSVGKYYVQSDGNLQSRAKSWLLDKIEEAKNSGNPLGN